MQEQRGAMGSFQETLGFEHGSTSSDVVSSPPNRLPDYILLNPTAQETEPGSSSGSTQPSSGHIEPTWSVKSCPEPPSSVLSLGDHGSSSSSFPNPFGTSSDPFELEARHMSRKRKAVELSIGQSSSGVGSLSSDPTIPRLGLSIGDPVMEAAHRDANLRIGSSGLVDPLVGDNNNNIPVENSSTHTGQPVLRVPGLRRNFQSTSRWSRGTSSRVARSPNLLMSGDRNEPDSISNHWLFTPPSDWNSNGDDGGNANNNGNGVAASSRPGPSSGSTPSQHPRRLSAFLRRSLLSTADLDGGGGQNGIFPRIPPGLSGSSSSSSSSSQDVGGLPGQQQSLSRSSLLLGRQLEGAFAFPFHSRTMTPGSEGRGRLVSEIRNVLDLMRRGEPLRFEDLMVLDQSVFLGVADIHDRHRDMRLDIDNMSYEELLALEERIGNVNTGLTEETILKHIVQKKYVVETGQPAAEPCCICQEEYKDGDDLGTLDCGHGFHHGCIKQWLQQKNLCPICKSTGFATTKDETSML
ncbi:E3 ubiquitin-protein ligase MBR2-like [Bidens hawaiensis]|uniref:E3 ubiquitin-protein ligase MBR2-like n=1 Tax=Bidens hawaiensis TaxID=980011 RepID=UPI004049E0E2